MMLVLLGWQLKMTWTLPQLSHRPACFPSFKPTHTRTFSHACRAFLSKPSETLRLSRSSRVSCLITHSGSTPHSKGKFCYVAATRQALGSVFVPPSESLSLAPHGERPNRSAGSSAPYAGWAARGVGRNHQKKEKTELGCRVRASQSSPSEQPTAAACTTSATSFGEISGKGVPRGMPWRAIRLVVPSLSRATGTSLPLHSQSLLEATVSALSDHRGSETAQHPWWGWPALGHGDTSFLGRGRDFSAPQSACKQEERWPSTTDDASPVAQRTRRFCSTASSSQLARKGGKVVEGNVVGAAIEAFPLVRVILDRTAVPSSSDEGCASPSARRRELLGDMTGREALREAEERGLDAVLLSGSDQSCPTCVLTSQLDKVLEERERRLHAKRLGLHNKHLGPGSPLPGTRKDIASGGRVDSENEKVEKKEDVRHRGEEYSACDKELTEALQEVGRGCAGQEKEGAAEFAFDPSRKIKTVRVSCVADERDMLRSAMTARKYLANGHRVEIHFVAQQQKKGTRVRKSHLVLLLERFVRECQDVGRPVSLPLSASLLETQAVIKVQIWPCTREQAAAFQLPRIALDTGREGGKKKTTVFRMGEEKRQAKIAECRRERDLLRSTRREADDHTD